MGSLTKEMKHLCRIPKIALRILGGYPTKDGKFNVKRMLIFLFSPIYCFYTALYTAIVVWPNTLEVTLNITPILCSAIVAFKFCNYMMYRHKFAKFFTIIEQDFWEKNEESSDKEKDILRNYGYFFYIFSIFQTITLIVAAFIWTYEPLAQMSGILPKRENHPEKLILPFDVWLPDRFDKHAHPVFDFLFGIQSVTTFNCSIILSALDTVFSYLVLSLCGQYRLLQYRLENFTKYETDLKRQEIFLHRCIEHHQSLCDFGFDLEVCMNKTILLQFFFSAGFLCLSGLIISLFPADTYNAIRNLIFIVAASLELFIYCYTADILTTECFQVSRAAYNSNWFESSESVKKLIFFIIVRAQQPFHLTAWKFTPANLESFESVIRTACSYFTVFNSVKEN